ncbi:hypothetical protein BpHYR1_004525 [Brachionus plicatilis]|uniref:Uncharacterized protein n=1 Tax=Brachionus plicatilis TaxID=10195 RepID=A0A3M7SJ97_BRAPC|nr:hypothetical protein BpHYR1_004525 [Brachionus plicatilis]
MSGFLPLPIILGFLSPGRIIEIFFIPIEEPVLVYASVQMGALARYDGTVCRSLLSGFGVLIGTSLESTGKCFNCNLMKIS